jgi:hypothetical protein
LTAFKNLVAKLALTSKKKFDLFAEANVTRGMLHHNRRYERKIFLTAIRMKWIQFPILDSKISQGIFCTSSLLSFSTPKFFKLDSNAEARASLHARENMSQQVTP